MDICLCENKIWNKELTEDLVQEIFIKAYKAYDNYFEEGKLRSWLMRIAQNTIKNYYSSKYSLNMLSLDAEDDDEDSLYHYLSCGITPEEDIIQKELISDIMSVVNRLPYQQKQVFTYRFIKGFSIDEISDMMQIPKGSVKSKTHYALQKVRDQLGITNKSEKGAMFMECKEIYKYLFMYAKGTLSDENKKLVKEHISKCKDCNDIVTGLKKLIPTMTFAKDDETSHFLIHFPEKRLSFSGISCQMKNADILNEVLEKNDGYIPEDECWFGNGFSKSSQLLAQFDNEGNEMEIKITPDNNSNIFRVKVIRMKKIYQPVMWLYDVYVDDGSYLNVKNSIEAPNLYYGSMHNCLGSENISKSALYQGVPSKAENIRIKRGNGVINCDTYNFAYVERYVTAEERLSLDYSFLLNK